MTHSVRQIFHLREMCCPSGEKGIIYPKVGVDIFFFRSRNGQKTLCEWLCRSSRPFLLPFPSFLSVCWSSYVTAQITLWFSPLRLPSWRLTPTSCYFFFVHSWPCSRLPTPLGSAGLFSLVVDIEIFTACRPKLHAVPSSPALIR